MYNFQPGSYITIHVKDVSRHAFEYFLTMDNRPLVVVGLLKHECKMSLLNVFLNRTSSSDEPIKSKEKLIFQCGFRRFSANPIFSQHTNKYMNKFKVMYLNILIDKNILIRSILII